ncbi:hypothetical protein LMH87_003144 [Akanthomyces muscarius]|uniref:Uncharacterized protein n=1 Tax=Akanthomyces muscarius TaxID=2231603 RepID=A0A9W8UGR9_AKAMU|nr:hypothetical protein LMH87_003144 [Akanthomyces muscarius]KAJ4144254.1 hypothetical protein LMH87_003144 [Akanthomyces muscarius]
MISAGKYAYYQLEHSLHGLLWGDGLPRSTDEVYSSYIQVLAQSADEVRFAGCSTVRTLMERHPAWWVYTNQREHTSYRRPEEYTEARIAQDLADEMARDEPSQN